MLEVLSVLLLGLLTGGFIWLYNRLVRYRNRVSNAWADIDVQLKRRHDLIPQLVTMVQAYADYEKATLTAVTELRTRSETAAHLPDKAQVEAAIADGVARLIVVAEDYPELKADQNFRKLQEELTEIEDHLQYARRFYNGAVRILNTRIETFPNLIIAGPFGFRPAEFFAVDGAEIRATPMVELG